MIKISESDKEKWAGGKIPFRDLLSLYQATTPLLCEGLGIHFAKHIVAVRQAADGWWPPEYAIAILNAREMYDLGMTEMAQGRDDHHFFLYSIPRKRALKAENRRYYFTYSE